MLGPESLEAGGTAMPVAVGAVRPLRSTLFRPNRLTLGPAASTPRRPLGPPPLVPEAAAAGAARAAQALLCPTVPPSPCGRRPAEPPERPNPLPTLGLQPLPKLDAALVPNPVVCGLPPTVPPVAPPKRDPALVPNPAVCAEEVPTTERPPAQPLSPLPRLDPAFVPNPDVCARNGDICAEGLPPDEPPRPPFRPAARVSADCPMFHPRSLSRISSHTSIGSRGTPPSSRRLHSSTVTTHRCAADPNSRCRCTVHGRAMPAPAARSTARTADTLARSKGVRFL